MKKTIVALAALSLFACKKTETPSAPGDVMYTSGVYVSNEGVFGSGESTLSHVNYKNSAVTPTAFLDKNGFTLGDVFQSMTEHNGTMYMVINQSGLIEMADATTLESKGQISGISQPRYMVTEGNMGYVSDWADNEVKVIDLTSNTVVNSVKVGEDPENMVIHNGKLYVANNGGSIWAPALPDSTVSIIDLNTLTEENRIHLAHAPQSLQIDANGDLWVLCAGFSDWANPSSDTEGKLFKIDVNTLTKEEFVFTDLSVHPARLMINGAKDKLFFTSGLYGGELYQMNISDNALPANSFISDIFYGLGVHPTTNEIYRGYSAAFDQNGHVYRYDANGAMIDSVGAGIGPNGFYFID
ncbi:MAG: glutaminyl-peptide cyclotransferase [Schleiferiaceae bacterium]|nr:glutaminyl-peptide cyclotransferase [Schleiferiaceae bacterium]